MPFTALVAEQTLLLHSIADIDTLAASDRFAGATPDTIAAILDGAAKLAVGSWAPLAAIGDTIGAQWTQAGVRMPDGYAAAYRDYVDGGWGAITVPEAFGGMALPLALQIAVLDSLGVANVGFVLCPMLTAGAIEALVHHGSPEQQARYLPHLATGAWTGTMNLTEPQAGTDVGALRARATPRGDGTWSIKGTKIFISYGDHDLAENIAHLVLARTPGAPEGTKGISLFLVPKYRLDADGRPGVPNDVRVVSIEHKMGLHISPTCVLAFGDDDDCIGELIGPELGGMRAMFTMMNNARLNIGLQGVQVAEAATRQAAAFALTRIQSPRAGAPTRTPVAIVEHPDVRRMLLRMKAQTQAARALVYYTAGQADRATLGDAPAAALVELLTPLAKAHSTDIGSEVASLGVQVHGGVGYVEETGAARHLRDARIFAIYEGTNGIHAADLVGRKLRLEDGAVFARLIAAMRAEAEAAPLLALIDLCERTGARIAQADTDDRLAASYPFLTMLATAVCGWLMERQLRADLPDAPWAAMKRATIAFYLAQIVPEAAGLAAAAEAGAAMLYAVPAEAFTA